MEIVKLQDNKMGAFYNYDASVEVELHSTS